MDERDLYLARLVRELKLPLEPVFALLAGDEDACERAARVLELLAWSGVQPDAGQCFDHDRSGEQPVPAALTTWSGALWARCGSCR